MPIGQYQRMSRVRHSSKPHGERLTWAAICRRYPDHYVTLVEIDWTKECDFKFRDALVLGCAKHREQSLAQARENGLRRYKSFGFYWTGQVRALPRFVQ